MRVTFMLAARLLTGSCVAVLLASAAGQAADQAASPPKRYRYEQRIMADQATEPPPLKKRIAVARFDDSTAVEDSPFGTLDPATMKKHQNDDVNSLLSKDLAVIRQGFTERMITALFGTNRFIIVERHDIHKVLREQDFAKSGRMSPAGNLPEGEMFSAQYIITGLVTLNAGESEDTSSDSEVEMALPIPGSRYRIGVRGGQAVPNPGASEVRGSDAATAGDRSLFDKDTEFNCPRRSPTTPARFAVHLRVYDVATSQVVSAVRASADTQWCLIKAAVNRMVAQTDRFPWKTRVAALEGDRVVLDGGQDVNMSAGYRVTHMPPQGRGAAAGATRPETRDMSIVEIREVTSVAEPMAREAIAAIHPGDWVVFNPVATR